MLQPKTASQYQAEAKHINKQMPGRSSSTTEMLRGQKIDVVQNDHVELHADCRDGPCVTTCTIMCGMALLFWPCNFILDCGRVAPLGSSNRLNARSFDNAHNLFW